jgi:hypothetical protein
MEAGSHGNDGIQGQINAGNPPFPQVIRRTRGEMLTLGCNAGFCLILTLPLCAFHGSCGCFNEPRDYKIF